RRRCRRVFHCRANRVVHLRLGSRSRRRVFRSSFSLGLPFLLKTALVGEHAPTEQVEPCQSEGEPAGHLQSRLGPPVARLPEKRGGGYGDPNRDENKMIVTHQVPR